MVKSFIVLLAGLALANSLRLPTSCSESIGRRAAITGLCALPGAAVAGLCILPGSANAALPGPYDKGELDLKERPKKLKCRPDGFGGKICADPDEDATRTAPVYERLLSGGSGESTAPTAPVASAAPKTKKTAAAKQTKVAGSSAPSLTVDEMVANSIAQKAGILGRELTSDEAAEVEAKVKSFMKSL